MSAIRWLQDFMDCVDGTKGPEAQRVANEWMEDHPDLPTDGTSWKAWRDFRQTWSPEQSEEKPGATVADQQWWTDEELKAVRTASFDPGAFVERGIVTDAYTDGKPSRETLWEWQARAVLAALAPAIERIQREAKVEALTALADQMQAEYDERTNRVGSYGQIKIRGALLTAAGYARRAATKVGTANAHEGSDRG